VAGGVCRTVAVDAIPAVAHAGAHDGREVTLAVGRQGWHMVRDPQDSDPCPCGSGQAYGDCCGAEDDEDETVGEAAMTR